MTNKNPLKQASLFPQKKEEMTRIFVGRAWVNETKGGYQVLNLMIDKNIRLAKGSRVALFPNNQREGKKDAQFRASVVVAQA